MSTTVVSLVLGLGALFGLFLCGLHLNRTTSMPLQGLLLFSGSIALCLIILMWRVRATIEVLRAPYVPMWLVTFDALLRVTPTEVLVWEIRSMGRLTLRLSRAGAKLTGDGVWVRFGNPLLGGLTWRETDGIVGAIETARTPNKGPMTLFAPKPQDAGRSRIPLLVCGATALVSLAAVFVFATVRRHSIEQMMRDGTFEEKSLE